MGRIYGIARVLYFVFVGVSIFSCILANRDTVNSDSRNIGACFLYHKVIDKDTGVQTPPRTRELLTKFGLPPKHTFTMFFRIVIAKEVNMRGCSISLVNF